MCFFLKISKALLLDERYVDVNNVIIIIIFLIVMIVSG